MSRPARGSVPHPSPRVGYLLFAMIVLVIVREWFPSYASPITYVAIVCGWGAAIYLVRCIGWLQRIQVSGMVLAGLVALVHVQQQTGQAPWLQAVSQSLPLVAMILSVGFLKRVALRNISASATLPTGAKAHRDTVFTVAIFGAFINISAVIIVADRLSKRAPLSSPAATAITRAFSTCVNWSPFFAGLAVVISYAPPFSVPLVIVQGVPMAVMGVGMTLLLARKNREQLNAFVGFPTHWSSLWIPTLLGVVVIAFRLLFDSMGLLPLIALSAMTVVTVYLFVSQGISSSVATLQEHITQDLPRSFNELTLLLAVGVLASGLVAWVNLGQLDWSPPLFTGGTAIIVLAFMLLIAVAGIHPVVSIAVASSLLIPVNPQPELLATTLLLGWSLGTLACPLSGLHLIMQGRYGIPSWQGASRQWGYVLIMFALSALWLQLLSYLHTV